MKRRELPCVPVWRACLCLWVASSWGCEITHRDGSERGDAAAKDAAVGMDAAARDAGKGPTKPDAATKDPNDDDGGDNAPVELSCEEQIKESLDGIPDEIACIGLYEDVRRKLIRDDVRGYAPAVALWSDGAGKQRWVYLPKGKKIDATNPEEWVFPIGTKFFKEFRANGRRVETRLYQKVRDDRWVRATFEWNHDETGATRSQGGDREDVTLYGVNYHLPSGRECDQCHQGRKDRILGFSAVSLGLAGAQGLTLQVLADEKLISPLPERTKLSIGDDGTGMASQVLGWLDINCGVSCHNNNQNAKAYSTGLRMKLHPSELDGRPPTDFEVLRTLIGVDTKTKRFAEQVRIDPGSPETSLLYRLVTTRGASDKEQMPPIASQVVDLAQVRLIEAWIRGM